MCGIKSEQPGSYSVRNLRKKLKMQVDQQLLVMMGREFWHCDMNLVKINEVFIVMIKVVVT